MMPLYYLSWRALFQNQAVTITTCTSVHLPYLQFVLWTTLCLVMLYKYGATYPWTKDIKISKILGYI